MTLHDRPVLPGLAEIRAELIAIRERANGIGVDVVRQKARRHHDLRAVLDELRHAGYLQGENGIATLPPDDHAHAVVTVVRCAVTKLVPDYRSQVILLHTLLDSEKKSMELRRRDAKAGIFFSENSDAAFAKLEKKAYTDLASHLTAAPDSPCWIEEADAAWEREIVYSLKAAANSALMLSASGRLAPEPVRRAARRLLEELLADGMDQLLELITLTMGVSAEMYDVRLLIAAVLDRYEHEFDQPGLITVLRDDLVGSRDRFDALVKRVALGDDKTTTARQPVQSAEEHRRTYERLIDILEREESSGWPSLPRPEGELAMEFQDL